MEINLFKCLIISLKIFNHLYYNETSVQNTNYNFQFAADYATTHLMKNLKNKIIEIKQLLLEKEPKELISVTPDNLTPRMKTKLIKIETHSTTNIRTNTSVDDSVIHNKHKQGTLNFKKDVTLKNIDDLTINPSSYVLNDGSINFSKLLIDEVLAADKLLVEAAKLTYDIAGNIYFY